MKECSMEFERGSKVYRYKAKECKSAKGFCMVNLEAGEILNMQVHLTHVSIVMSKVTRSLVFQNEYE